MNVTRYKLDHINIASKYITEKVIFDVKQMCYYGSAKRNIYHNKNC